MAIDIGVWCNGNTTDSGPVILGSSPSTPTFQITNRLILVGWFLFNLTKGQTLCEVYLYSAYLCSSITIKCKKGMAKESGKKIDRRRATRLLAFLELEVESLNRKNKLGLAENYKYSGNSFRDYLSTLHKKDVPLSRVSEELLIAYQQWLWDRGIKRNTSVFYLRNLHAVYNKAVGQGLVTDRKPFGLVQTNITHTEKRAVSPELIRDISTLDISDGLVRLGQDPRKKPFQRMLRELTFARDTFIFCFCARGLTFVDFAYLKRENIRHGRIVYERRKTGQYIEVEIQPQMQAFIDKYAVAGGPYLFPVLTDTDIKTAHKQYNSAIRRYNKHLNRLSKMLGLNIPLTSYVSRHSWATAAYHADFPVSHISEGMGHTSEKTTRIYLKSLESSKIDRENKRLLDGIFKVALF